MALGGVGSAPRRSGHPLRAIARGGEPVALRHGRDRASRTSRPNAPAQAQRLLSPVAGLVRRRHPEACAAAGQRQGRPHRLQDRHLLRLPRRLGGRLRRPAHGRRLGRPAGRRGDAGPHRTHAPRRRCCSMPSRAHRRDAGRRLPPAPRGVLRVAGSDLPPPLKRFKRGMARSRRARAGAFLDPPPLIAFPPDRAELEFLDDGGDGRRAQGRRRRAAADLADRRAPDWRAMHAAARPSGSPRASALSASPSSTPRAASTG